MNKFIIDPHLSEKNLGDVLKWVFGEDNVKRQHRIHFEFTGDNFVVDYKVQYGKTTYLVEFDGPTHYTSFATITRDNVLNDYPKFCKEKVILVHIPYFVQLNDETFTKYFGMKTAKKLLIDVNKTIITNKKHGFQEKKIVLPCDYSAAGFKRFLSEFSNIGGIDKGFEHWQVARDIFESLHKREDMESFLDYLEHYAIPKNEVPIDALALLHYPT